MLKTITDFMIWLGATLIFSGLNVFVIACGLDFVYHLYDFEFFTYHESLIHWVGLVILFRLTLLFVTTPGLKQIKKSWKSVTTENTDEFEKITYRLLKLVYYMFSVALLCFIACFMHAIYYV